jgi:hypothetical protein
VGLSVYPPIVARQGLGKHVPAVTKYCGDVIFYAVRVVSKESRRLVLTGTSCLIFSVVNSVSLFYLGCGFNYCMRQEFVIYKALHS